MWRQVRGVPRSDIKIATWWSDSGESDQKSHCMLLLRKPVSGIRFCEWMKSRVAVGIGITLLAGQGGEAGEHGRALAHLVQEGGLGPRRNVRGHLEVAERTATFGVDD